MLTDDDADNQFRPRTPRHAKVKAITAAALGAGLVLLCACATRGHPPGTPSPTPPNPTTSAPAGSATPTAADVPSPSPTPDVGPSAAAPTDSVTVAETGSSATDLAIAILGPIQVAPGETAIYSLTLHNQGPALATGIVFTSALPTGVVPAWTEPGQTVCGRQESTVGCDLGELQPGTAFTITLDLSIGGDETPITGTQLPGEVLPGVIVDSPVPSCAPGSSRTGPRVVCNLGRLLPGARAQVRVAVGVSGSFTGTLVHTATIEANEADENLLNNHAVFTSTVAEVRSVLEESEGAGIASTATLTTDLVLQASAPSTVIAGLPFTYAYTISNRGTMDATGVGFENTVPAATILNGFEPGHPPCEWREDAITCYLRDLATGESITVTLVATGHSDQSLLMWLDPLMPGWPICYLLKERDYLHIVVCEFGVLRPGQTTLVTVGYTAIGLQERVMVNTASVEATEAEPNAMNNTSTTTITVIARSDLALWSEFAGPTIADRAFSYTLTIANLGPSDAANILLTDTLPMGASLVSAVPSLGTDCAPGLGGDAAGTLGCRVGRLNSGEIATVTVSITFGDWPVPAAEDSIIHSARITADQIDPDASNNELTEYIPVSQGTED